TLQRRPRYHYATYLPYTTLFRSRLHERRPWRRSRTNSSRSAGSDRTGCFVARTTESVGSQLVARSSSYRIEDGTGCGNIAAPPRSEEHTSELQSRENLVCIVQLE